MAPNVPSLFINKMITCYQNILISRYENFTLFGSSSWNPTMPPESEELLNYVQMQCSDLRNALIQKYLVVGCKNNLKPI